MKTILITSFHVLISRNILAAPFFDLLKERGDIRMVLVVPEQKISFFQEQFGGDRVVVEGVMSFLNRRDGFFKDLGYAAVRTRTLSLLRKRGLGFEHPIMQKILFWAPLIRRFIPTLYRMTMPRYAYADLFDRYKPDAVFATDVFGSADVRLMHEAKLRKVRVIGMVRSWDNLTAKGGFRVIPDVLAVQNDIVAREAREIHRIPASILRVVGIPHYDRYDGRARSSKDAFAARIGADPAKRFILYGPLGDRIVKVGDRIIPHRFDQDMIMLLWEIMPPTHQLIVRLPPSDTISIEGIPENAGIVFDRPGVLFGNDFHAIRKTELTRKDDDHLIDTIIWSDLVVTVFSTIAIDAAVLDRPAILLGFDPYPVPWIESVARLLEFDHMQPLLQAGMSLAHSRENLTSLMQRYLAHPEINRDSRRRVAEEQCSRLNHRSSERLRDVILDTLFLWSG